MKRSNQLNLKEAIQEFLEHYRLDGKMRERQVIASWEEVMGKMVSQHTTSLNIRNGILYVKVDSAALRHELSYAKEDICRVLNETVKTKVITEVVIR